MQMYSWTEELKLSELAVLNKTMVLLKRWPLTTTVSLFHFIKRSAILMFDLIVLAAIMIILPVTL